MFEINQLNCGKQLVNDYVINKNKESLKDAVGIFFKENEQKSLIEVLNKIERKNEDVIYELCKAAIFVNDKEVLSKNIRYLSDFYKIKLIKYFKTRDIELEDIKKEVAYNKKIGRFDTLVNQLKENRKLNELINLYYSYDLFEEIIEIYKWKNKFSYSSDSIKYIGKSLERMDLIDEAGELYLQGNSFIEALNLYERKGRFEKVFKLTKEKVEKCEHEDLIFFGKKLINSSLQINTKECLEEAQKISEKINYYRKNEIKIKLYEITGDYDYLVEVLKSYIRVKDNVKIIDTFELKEEVLIKKLDDKEILKIGEIYEELNENKKAIYIYEKLNKNVKIIELLKVEEDSQKIIKIYEGNKEEFKENLNLKVIEAYKYEGAISRIIGYPMKLKAFDIVISLLDEIKERDKIIKIYKEAEGLILKKETYKIVLNIFRNKGNIEEAIKINLKLEDYEEVLKLALDLDDFELVKSIIEDENKSKHISKIEEKELQKKLAEIYEKNQEIEKALEFYKKINSDDNKMIEMYYKLEDFKSILDIVYKSGIGYEKEELIIVNEALYRKNIGIIMDEVFTDEEDKYKENIEKLNEVDEQINYILNEEIDINIIDIDIFKEKYQRNKKLKIEISEYVEKTITRKNLDTYDEESGMEIEEKIKEYLGEIDEEYRVVKKKISSKEEEISIERFLEIEEEYTLLEDRIEIDEKNKSIKRGIEELVQKREDKIRALIKEEEELESWYLSKKEEYNLEVIIEEETKSREQIKVVMYSEGQEYRREEKKMERECNSDNYFKATVDITLNLIEMGFTDDQIIKATKGVLTEREIEMIKYIIDRNRQIKD